MTSATIPDPENHRLGQHRLRLSCRRPADHAQVCAEAKQNGVSIGVHPGFNDLWGFGRRRIDMKPDDLECMVAYQIGALQAMAALSGVKVTHLKPHGALNNMAAENARTMRWRSAAPSRRSIPASSMSRWPARRWKRPVASSGLRVAVEGFCDRQYDDDGNLDLAQDSRLGAEGSAVACRQVIDMVREGNFITSRNGKNIPCKVHSLCVHGDEPTGVATARAVRAALEEGRRQACAADRNDAGLSGCAKPYAYGKSVNERETVIAILGGTGDLGVRPRQALGRRRLSRRDRFALSRQGAGALPQEFGRRMRAATTNVGAAAAAEIIVLAVPFASHDATLLEVKDAVQPARSSSMPRCRWCRRRYPWCSCRRRARRRRSRQTLLGEGVRVVSAFHNVGASKLHAGGRVDCDVLVFGDDKACARHRDRAGRRSRPSAASTAACWPIPPPPKRSPRFSSASTAGTRFRAPAFASRDCRRPRQSTERVDGHAVSLYSAVPGLPLVQPGDDLAALIADAVKAELLRLVAGDIVVVAQKIVSKAEGRYVELARRAPLPSRREPRRPRPARTRAMSK